MCNASSLGQTVVATHRVWNGVTVKKQLSAFSSLFVLTLLANSAGGDWPMSRHDPQRTGVATGKSNIIAPVPYWRQYLGGELAAAALMAADVDGDQARELIYVTAGRVTVSQPDGTVVWQTDPIGVTTLIAITDLDGAGGPEVVARSSNQVYVFAGATGKVQWVEPEGEMGTIAGVRVGDLDGDGVPELVIRECGCCAISGTSPGVVYSFAAGAAAPKLLWQFPPFGGCSDGNAALVLADVDGIGPREVVSTIGSTASVFDGSTGSILATSPTPGDASQYDACAPFNVDGVPGDEIVCIRSPPLQPADGERKAYVLRYDAGTKKLGVLWSKYLAPYAGGDLRALDPLGDLDGDGSIELVVSTSAATDVWSTRVLDAMTGAEKATLPDRTVAGRLPLGPTKGSLLLTTSASSTLTAWSYDPATSPALAFKWTLVDAKGLTFADPDRMRTAGPVHWERQITVDLDADGLDDMVVRDVTSSASRVSMWSAAGGQPMKLGSFEMPIGVEAARAWNLPPIGASQSRVAVERNDGHLVLLDAKAQPTNAKSALVPGIRTGGYYATGGWREHQRGPVVGSLDGGAAQGIVAVDSRRALVRLEAAEASLASPPKVVWQKTHAYSPVIVAALDGANAGVACLAQQEPVTAIPQDLAVTLRADGSTLWAKPLPRSPINDIVPGILDADAVPDLIVQHASASDTLLRTRALSGATGATLWNAQPIDPGCGRQPTGFAVADWNGDGRTDVVFQALATRVLSGIDGAQLLQGGSTACYYLPTLIDLDGDKVDEVVLQGGYTHAQAWSHDLATKLWGAETDDRPYPYGAAGSCPTGLVLAEGSWQHPARLKLSQMNGTAPGASLNLVLAGGKAWNSEGDAKAGGAALAQLGSTSVHSNLAGKGQPVAVVGSSDGWLYAIDPCTASLAFTHEFTAPVGNVVFGDSDGDGHDELLVSVADGYLYALKQPPIAAPAEVIDTDPDHGIDTADVDDISTIDQLSGAWTRCPVQLHHQSRSCTPT